MSFYEVLQKHKNFAFNQVNEADVLQALSKERLNENDFLALLSEKATPYLEQMAQRALKLTLQNFGKSILIYTPMYLSNYCTNSCLYCGFNAGNKVKRRKLTLEEVEKEAKYLASFDLKHILILTGEAKEKTPLSYIKQCVEILKKYFSSISIEIFPLSTEEYNELIDLGIDGLTIYQEVYDEIIYDEVHLSGPKKDYKFRLDAPERAAEIGIRTLNIGALLGLGDLIHEAFFTGLHADYLQDKYPDVEVSVSVPRIQPHTGNFKPNTVVADKDLVQIILALRLFMPRVGITLSTRESAALRDNLLPLGVTKMSANSTTAVGGHTIKEENSNQFNISDNRTVDEIKTMLLSNGYQAVFKDWISC